MTEPFPVSEFIEAEPWFASTRTDEMRRPAVRALLGILGAPPTGSEAPTRSPATPSGAADCSTKCLPTGDMGEGWCYGRLPVGGKQGFQSVGAAVHSGVRAGSGDTIILYRNRTSAGLSSSSRHPESRRASADTLGSSRQQSRPSHPKCAGSP